MKKILAVTVMSFALLAAGCATAYRSSDESLTGGFSEIRLTPDSWRVLVEGNAFTSRGEAEQILLRRSAELTLERGKRYFVLSGHDAWLNATRTSRRHVVTSPVNVAVVTALDAYATDAFDAIAIVAETNEIAENRLSASARATLEALQAAGR